MTTLEPLNKGYISQHAQLSIVELERLSLFQRSVYSAVEPLNKGYIRTCSAVPCREVNTLFQRSVYSQNDYSGISE